MNRPPTPSPRPRIWAIGISKLRDLYRDIADEYDGRADLRLVSRGYEDAVNEIVAAGAHPPDIVVAAGSNGMYLKARQQQYPAGRRRPPSSGKHTSALQSPEHLVYRLML